MFHGELNLRQIKRHMQDHAHEMGLTATVVCRKQIDYVDFIIDLRMNQNRFNSYMHKENGRSVISPASQIRQMQAESGMIVSFWNGLLPELARAKRRIQWWSNEAEDSSSEPTKYDIRHGSVEELRLRDISMLGRTMRVFL